MNKKIILFFGIFIFVAVALLQIVAGQTIGSSSFLGGNRGTASYVNYGTSFNRYYGSEISNYWPVLGNRDTCEARQDIMIQISPGGCQPAVVRSDLLAEQNVPVFCQLDLLQINPVIDVKQIRSLRFNGKYPSYVAGVGFHPARAALRTRDKLLGSPLESNIGYVVIILKRTQNETALPEFFNFTLSATVDYYSGNAIGLGVTEMLLRETSDEEWKVAKNKQTFFKGKYSVRLLESDLDSAELEIYRGDERFNDITLSRQGNQQTRQIYLPGHYCQTALQFSYSDFISSQKTARIQVDDDVFDAYTGLSFLNNQCSVRKITGDGVDGRVEINCGREKLILVNTFNILVTGSEIYKIDKQTFLPNTNEKWKITKIDSTKKKYSIKSLTDTNKPEEQIEFDFVRPIDSKVLSEATYGENEKYIENAIDGYEKVADDFGNERVNNIGGIDLIGERAIVDAIDLAEKYGKKKTVVRLIEKYLSLYPQGSEVNNYADKLNSMYILDTSASAQSVETDDGVHHIKLLDVFEPDKKSSVKINWGDAQNIDVNLGETATHRFGQVVLTNIRDVENAEVNVTCVAGLNQPTEQMRGGKVYLKTGDNYAIVCGRTMRLTDVNIERFVKVKISPITKTSTVGNFTVGIGIEKRAIELTPDKARKMINNLNDSIKRLESISNKLGEVVKGLKAACFATAGILTVKNFFIGLSGEALARREVMGGEDGWTKYCQDAVNRKEFGTLNACYNSKSGDIAKDVAARTLAIKKANDVVGVIEEGAKSDKGSGFFGGSSFDDGKARQELISRIKSECSDVSLGDKSRAMSKINVGQLFSTTAVNVEQYSYSQLRDIYFNCQVVKGGGSSAQGLKRATTALDTMGVAISERQKYEEDKTALENTIKNTGLNGKQIDAVGDKDSRVGDYYGGKLNEGDFGLNGYAGKSAQIVQYNNIPHLIILTNTGGTLNVDKSFQLDKDSSGNFVVGSSPVETTGTTKNVFSKFELRNAESYFNSFAKGEANVRFFETDPYKGMPAIVPFDLNRGFYVATKQSLPILGGTKSFEANGRPASFFVCNVMGDGKIGFYAPNYGDDECVQFNLDTGQPLNLFPGLSKQATDKLVSEAKGALESAARQYSPGVKNIKIGKNTLNLGNAVSLMPGAQCQDFMSPEDCKLLFNVCDPVICPNTRCNFGGDYQVADVIQTGIVGSALLCLPNINEGIYVPVCLTGIQAGLDGYLSIMKSHQSCLQESIDTGQYVGTCDQIYSIYLCEFFWKQAAPLASLVVPKLFEMASGQTTVRGGGEYMTVQSSWSNAADSAKYFTQSYAVNAIEAFNIRSVEEAGTPFCKSFISAKGPTTFESLIEPDSPPQFHAWFSAFDYTDATVPATSQYKVFYHIFAGKDRGVSYNVYLKDPPAGIEYSANPFIQVANGFAARGGYATETRDFVAPKGYKQLCVRINDKEECGFKQVSTSFAINQIRDNFVSDELKRKDITTESECISGGVASPLSLLNPNIQAAAQEAIEPDIYNRGVVRICATSNPGTGTDPARFVKVGDCGESRMGCWLDTKSVDRAITDSNIGVRNKTITEITQSQRENIFGDKNYVSDNEFNVELQKQREIIEKTGFGDKSAPGLNEVVVALDGLKKKSLLNNHLAQVIFWNAVAHHRTFENIRGAVQNVDSICVTANDCSLKYGGKEEDYLCTDGFCQSKDISSQDGSSGATAPASGVDSGVGVGVSSGAEGFLQLSENVGSELMKEKYSYVFLLGGNPTRIFIDKGGNVILLDDYGEKIRNLGRLNNAGRYDLIESSRNTFNEAFGTGSFEIIKSKNSLGELISGYYLFPAVVKSSEKVKILKLEISGLSGDENHLTYDGRVIDDKIYVSLDSPNSGKLLRPRNLWPDAIIGLIDSGRGIYLKPGEINYIEEVLGRGALDFINGRDNNMGKFNLENLREGIAIPVVSGTGSNLIDVNTHSEKDISIVAIPDVLFETTVSGKDYFYKWNTSKNKWAAQRVDYWSGPDEEDWVYEGLDYRLLLNLGKLGYYEGVSALENNIISGKDEDIKIDIYGRPHERKISFLYMENSKCVGGCYDVGMFGQSVYFYYDQIWRWSVDLRSWTDVNKLVDDKGRKPEIDSLELIKSIDAHKENRNDGRNLIYGLKKLS